MRIIIPATSIHRPVVELSIERLKRRYPLADILIITPAPDVFAEFKCDTVQIGADADYSPITKAELAATLFREKAHLAGWYFQQFLKYAAVAAAQDRRVLVLDADTVVLRDIECEPGTFFTSKARHRDYYEHFKILFGDLISFQASAITNFMWFDSDEVRRMLVEICERHSKSWWLAIISIANGIHAECAFSEYETYANWVSLRHGCHTEVPIHIFWRGDLLLRSRTDHYRVLREVEKRGYDAVAFEMQHRRGIIRQLGARFILNFSIRRW
jgi:hypothetical protein